MRRIYLALICAVLLTGAAAAPAVLAPAAYVPIVRVPVATPQLSPTPNSTEAPATPLH